MRSLFHGHSAAMAYLKLETLDWQLRVTNRKKRVVGKSELRKRLLKDLAARKREA
ncbi:hypothetical protein [Selenomonas ruminantium]|uniref:hypothetical protein n=1 Tax=Selenomonas ruminantium TaxID=971 RepID=UPI0026F0B2A1|nr:hypothetical protein [Selenomonas ruminantium]